MKKVLVCETTAVTLELESESWQVCGSPSGAAGDGVCVRADVRGGVSGAASASGVDVSGGGYMWSLDAVGVSEPDAATELGRSDAHGAGDIGAGDDAVQPGGRQP